MKKTMDYTLGIILGLFICLLWYCQTFQTPIGSFITMIGLILFFGTYTIYIRYTRFVYLANLLIIPLMLWFVSVKEVFITSTSSFIISTSFLGFVSVFICLILALYKFIHSDQNFSQRKNPV